MDHKIRVNAAISYLFLGELFLLAKHNPDFSHSFIRSHSKNASKLHLIFLILIIAYKYLIASFDFVNYHIPVLSLNIDTIVVTAMFVIFTFLILRGSYKAFSGKDAEDIKIRKDYLRMETKHIGEATNEVQKMAYISSFIPFIGLISAKKFPSVANSYGVKVSGLFSLILVFLILSDHPDILLALSLVYIFFIVFSGVMMIAHSKAIVIGLIDKMPDLDTCYRLFRASFMYFIESFKVIFGKKDELSFKACYEKVLRNERKFMELARNYLDGDKLIFSNKLIFIPIINIIFIPKYIFDRKSRYALAIAQGLIISALLAAIYLSIGSFYTNIPMLLLFPIFLGIANIDQNPFYRIPFIYEIYMILDKLTFGIFSKFKFLKEKKNEVKEVSFKVN